LFLLVLVHDPQHDRHHVCVPDRPVNDLIPSKALLEEPKEPAGQSPDRLHIAPWAMISILSHQLVANSLLAYDEQPLRTS